MTSKEEHMGNGSWVGRREFLKGLGAAAATTVAPSAFPASGIVAARTQ